MTDTEAGFQKGMHVMKEIYSTFRLGDMCAVYLLEGDTGTCGLTLLPWELKDRLTLEGWWNIEPVVQMKLLGDAYPDGFSHGHSMRNSATVTGLVFREQREERQGAVLRVTTVLEREGVEVSHILEYTEGSLFTVQYTRLHSRREAEVGVEMISSYNLCAFSGLEPELRMEDLVLHRMQSKWSMEGKLESVPFLDLQLEPAWLRIGANSLRFGQVGSMPVRRYFPWMIAEDRKYGYGIGIQVCHPASWQMEVYNRDDRIALSGGLADREFGHWMKYLKKDQVFETPPAIITAACEDVDGISHRLTSAQRANLDKVPEVERTLPIIFNEYCTTWGNPSEENMLKIVDALRGRGITYCVIDAGWHIQNGSDWSDIGDWITNQKQFPNGLSHVARAMREAGMIPGLWYEMEVAGEASRIFREEEYLLHRDGFPLQTGHRRFLDMRKPRVREYLRERVTENLRQCGFGYLKVDYNDNIGIGCDGAESLGEGLRQNMAASQDFFRELRQELPDLVIENCSSGGHRTEPSMQALASMASFSDAHECNAIPVIAANVTRAILPAQSQIWAVLRRKDSEKRLYYSLSNTFLGRMCLSGDVCDLEEWQWRIAEEGMAFYKRCAPVIRNGRSFRQGPHVDSYNHLRGWQAVCRRGEDGAQMLVVAHSFEACGNVVEVQLPEAGGHWQISGEFYRKGISVELREDRLLFSAMEAYDGAVILLSC